MSAQHLPDRRRFLALLGATTLAFGAWSRRALAAALPHLSDTANATAKALHYTEDAGKAPTPHQPGQDCANCMHFQGKADQAWGPCALFPGFDVKAKGWCTGYAVKS